MSKHTLMNRSRVHPVILGLLLATGGVAEADDQDIAFALALRVDQFGIGSPLSGLAVGDFDGDRFLDLVLARDFKLVVLRNQDGEAFVESGVFDLSSSTSLVAVDMDGDMNTDLVLTGDLGNDEEGGVQMLNNVDAVRTYDTEEA